MQKVVLVLSFFILATQGVFSEGIQVRELPKEKMQKQNKKILQLAAKELSKTLPQKIDTYTELVNIESKDTTLLYIYEINTGAKSDEAIQKEDRSRMKEAVTYGICKTYKRFLDVNITISYLYTSAKSKVKLFRFDVTQKDCIK